MGHAAKAAVDIALRDIYAQRCSTSLAKSLNHSTLTSQESDATVSLRSPEAMEQQVRDLMSAGFQFFKMKLGGHDGQDILVKNPVRVHNTDTGLQGSNFNT